MATDDKSSGLVQGTLYMLILKTLTLEPMHGYGIGVRLEQISKGVFQVNAGSLFPALGRLERDGLIAGEWRVTENNRRAKILQADRAGARETQARNSQLGSAGGRSCQRAQGDTWRSVMAFIKNVTAGLRRLLRRSRVEDEMDEELHAFLDASIERKMQAGMTCEAATRAARVELGSAAAVKDRIRDLGWESVVDQLIQDVRYAVRSLRKARGLTAVTVGTLALGIGTNTAIFQLADAVRLRSLPVDHPEQLVEVRMGNPERGRMGTFAGRRPLFTNALWEELRRAPAGVLRTGRVGCVSG